MPDSFQLELPEPDPDEEPLELEGEAGMPPGVAKQTEQSDRTEHSNPAGQSDPAARRRFFVESREDFLASSEIRQPDNETLPPEALHSRDPDELWQENAAREAHDELRFSLAELFVVTALLAAILTIGRFVRLPLLAGVLGLLVLIGLGVISNHQRSRVAYIVWVTLIMAYIFIAVGAAWKLGR